MQARWINGGVEYVSQLKQEEGSFKQGGPTSTVMEAQELQAVSLSDKQNDWLGQWNSKSLCSIWVLLKKEVWHACV